MSPSRTRQRSLQHSHAGTGQAARRGQRPGPGRRGRRRSPVLLWAAALVVVLGAVAVLLGGLGSNRSEQSSSGQRETGTVTVSGDALPPLPQAGADPAVGRPAPALSGTDFEGRPVSVAAGGNPRVLIFLAHWCPHCRNEVPELTRWLGQDGLPAGVTLTSVSTGSDSSRPNYPPSAWLQREGWPLPVLVDDPSGSAANAYGLTGFPMFVFIDADGTVAGRYAGELGVQALRERIDALRAGAATATTTAAAPAVRVEMGEMWFRPAAVKVPAGKPVRLLFHNAGRVAHQALAGDRAEQDAAEARAGAGGPPGRTVTVAPGETGELLVTVARGTTYLLGCHLPGHWAAGMRGTVAA